VALKTVRTSIRLDKEDIDFLKEEGIFKNTSEGTRWCIKFCKLYGIPAIKRIREFDGSKA
jgi:hypothetical protein